MKTLCKHALSSTEYESCNRTLGLQSTDVTRLVSHVITLAFAHSLTSLVIVGGVGIVDKHTSTVRNQV